MRQTDKENIDLPLMYDSLCYETSPMVFIRLCHKPWFNLPKAVSIMCKHYNTACTLADAVPLPCWKQPDKSSTSGCTGPTAGQQFVCLSDRSNTLFLSSHIRITTETS